jgi:TPR repeat protein
MDYVQAIRYYQDAEKADEATDSDVTTSHSAEIFNLVDENLQPQSALTPDFAGFARVMSIYLKATKREDAAAMSQLGDWYAAGRYMPQDKVEACRWYNLAAGRGMADAAKKRDTIKALLDPNQKEQALKPPAGSR